MSVQNLFSSLAFGRTAYPCLAGKPPVVGFAVTTDQGDSFHVGLAFQGDGISAGAMTNTFVQLQGACLGRQRKEELIEPLFCSNAAGLVDSCDTFYRRHEARLGEGVALGAAQVNNTSAQLIVFGRNLGAMACYAEHLPMAVSKAAGEFPLSPPSFDEGDMRSNAASRIELGRAGWMAVMGSVLLGMVASA